MSEIQRNHFVEFSSHRKYWACEFDSYSEFEAFAKYWGVEPVKPE
jgi:hypothetical protein